MRLGPAFLFVSCLLSACSADRDEPAGRASSPVIGGTPDDTHTAVVAVALSEATNVGIGFCTGVLVAPNLVLTARHCVSDQVENTLAGVQCDPRPNEGGTDTPPDANGATVPAARFLIFNDANPSPSSPQGPEVLRVVVPPGSDGAPNCGHDLALLQLKSAWAGVTPIAPRLDAPPAAGEPLTVIGYGFDGAVPNSDGRRRLLAGAKVSSVGMTKGTGGFLRTTDAEWTIDRGPCGGDSGGPVFDASDRTIGVMSRGSPTVCQSMIYQRLDLAADWLREAARAAAKDLGEAPVAWAAEGAGDGGAEAGGGAAAPAGPEASSGCAMAGDGGARSFPLAGALLALVALRARRRSGRRAARRDQGRSSVRPYCWRTGNGTSTASASNESARKG